MSRLIGCALAGWAAMMIGRAAGLPLWSGAWPSDWSMTDASDVAVLVAVALWNLTRPARPSASLKE